MQPLLAKTMAVLLKKKNQYRYQACSQKSRRSQIKSAAGGF
jgi:hypothetical protein